MTVRRLRPEDLQLACDAVRTLKQHGAGSNFDATTARQFLSKPENVLIVSSNAGSPVGFLLAYLLDRVDGSQPMACLYEIDVSQSFRRCGVGRAMIEVLKELCGVAHVMKMWTVTHRSNEAAVELFKSTGANSESGADELTIVWKGESRADGAAGNGH